MKTLYMIGNAHLDPVWLWNWQEGFQENRATFASVLDRMDEFDDFVFTSSSAQFYEWIEENDPEMFRKIQKRVKEGRWILCGGWWIQPDVNIPSGESFARQSLIGQNYFLDKFGVTAKTGYCVDSFGHNAMLPQILKKSGMENYVYMRPNETEKPDLGQHVFLWEAPDGSRVTAFRIAFSYGNWQNLEETAEKTMQECQPGIDRMMCFYGVGNHGGGPTIENIRTVRKMKEEWKDTVVKFSDPDSFFRDIRGYELPVVKGELQYHSPGCYSAESMIKQKNREAENALLMAEKFSVLSGMLGRRGNDGQLTHAWKDVLFNQFHDILAGSAIKSAYEEARNGLGEAIITAHRCTNDALNKISAQIDIPLNPQRTPLLVFNPHSFEISEPVEFEQGMFGNAPDLRQVRICDHSGKTIAHQMIAPSCCVPERPRLTFQAEVPAMGYALYYAEQCGPSEHTVSDTEAENPFVLENESLKVSFSEETGTIASLYDKNTGKEYFCEDCSVSVIDDHRNDTWGHKLKRLDQVIGRFELVSAKVLDSGPVRKAVRFVSRYGSSRLVQTFALYQGENRIRVHFRVNCQEQQKAIKLYFPLDLSEDSRACTEIPYGNIEKNRNGREETMQRWCDLSDDRYGLSIINDAKYAVDFTGNRIGITVLRSTIYAHHQPYVLQKGEDYEYMDQGISEFSYMIVPHAEGWTKADTVREAEVFNQKPVTMFESYHRGTLPAYFRGFSVDKKNIILSALKYALKSDDIILRFYESQGTETDVSMEFCGHPLRTHFGPYEVKTFLMDSEGTFMETDLLERKLPKQE